MPSDSLTFQRLLRLAARVAAGERLTPWREQVATRAAVSLRGPVQGGGAQLLDMARAARGSGAFRRSLEMIERIGLLENWIPELAACRGVGQNRFHAYDVATHTLEAADAAGPDSPMRRVALLLHDIGKPATRTEVDGKVQFLGHDLLGAKMAQDIAERLGFSSDEVAWLVEAVAEHMRPHHLPVPPTHRTVMRMVGHLKLLTLEDLIAIRMADKAGSGVSSSNLDESWANGVREAAARTPKKVVGRTLAVNGQDVQDVLGIPQGPVVGTLLKRLEAIIQEDPGVNTREYLLEAIPRVARAV